MARFTLEAGTMTLAFSVAWAFRMRVSMSAMGSLMLIVLLLPARLDHPGDLAAHGDLADLVAREPELAERPARAARDGAAVAQAHGRRIARHRRDLRARLVAGVVGRLGVVDDGAQLLALLGVLPDHGFAPGLAVDDGELGHYVLSVLKGNLKAARRAFASGSDFAVVVIEMFIPRSASTLSYSISGKMICSLMPML